MPNDLMREGARGGGITLIAQLLKTIIMMTSVVVLSRLLTPDAIGVVAMVTVVVAFGDMLRDLGLSTAALRAPTLTSAQSSNLFWANTSLGAVGSLVIAAIAPLLVAFYGEPRLLTITPILGLSVLLGGAQAQYQVQLARRRKYVALNLTDVLAQFSGLLFATWAALAGWSYWALVVQTLTISTVLLVSRVIASRWIPAAPSRGNGTMPLIKSGVEFSATQVLTFLAGNTDSLMVGRNWGSTSLGLYNRAYQLLTVPVGRLLSPLVNVVVPIINQARANGASIFVPFLKIQSLVGLGSTLLFATAVTVADPLIPLVLGAEWRSSIPLFQILAVCGVAQALSQVSYWVFLVEGQSRELLKYNILTKGLTVVVVIAGSFVSLEATALALSLSLLLSWPINIIWLSRTSGLPATSFLANGTRYLAIGTLSVVAVWGLANLISIQSGPWATVAINGLLTVAIFFSMLALLPAGRRDLRATLGVLYGLLR